MTMFRLCRQFGWTPSEVREQSCTDIDALLVLLDELNELQDGARSSGGKTIVVRDD